MMKIIVLHGNDQIGQMQRLAAFLNEDVLSLDKGYQVVSLPGSGWPWLDFSDTLDQLAGLCRDKDAYQVFFYGDGFGSEAAARLSARLGVPCVSSAERIEADAIVRKVYSSYLEAYYPANASALIVSINPAGVKNRAASMPIPTDTTVVRLDHQRNHKGIVRLDDAKPWSENGLADAQIVFVGGKGLQSRENYELMKTVAESVGAASAITRPGALSGWDSVGRIIGQSGCSISPRLCVAIGVSGAAPFMSGVENARRLVAINTDADAPIFKYADDGIITDGPRMLRYLAERINDGWGVNEL